MNSRTFIACLGLVAALVVVGSGGVSAYHSYVLTAQQLNAGPAKVMGQWGRSASGTVWSSSTRPHAVHRTFQMLP